MIMLLSEAIYKSRIPFSQSSAIIYDCVTKRDFVNAISHVFSSQQVSVQKIELKLFINAKELLNNKFLMEEYVVVTYKGGAIAPSNNYANSVTATYRNIGTLLTGGNYDQLPAYNAILSSEDYEEIEID